MRILICDDHTLFVEGVKAMLRNELSLEIVGEARDGRQAVELVKQLKPDVILMDVSMPDMNGFDATRRVHEFDSNVRVLILTMHDEEELVARCLEAGAAGYIIKDAPASQLLYAIEMVHKGERYLSPNVLKKVVDGYVRNTNRPQTSYDRLTSREREVLKLLAEGLTVKEIAVRLDLSVKTVEVHKHNLMKKIDVHDKTELIKYAIQKKLIAV
ncbi:MAG: response regulator transcription factor [Blastocatellia bacterium]|nr:response regulator transcription factor [Blastocatellia bacterium]